MWERNMAFSARSLAMVGSLLIPDMEVKFIAACCWKSSSEELNWLRMRRSSDSQPSGSHFIFDWRAGRLSFSEFRPEARRASAAGTPREGMVVIMKISAKVRYGVVFWFSSITRLKREWVCVFGVFVQHRLINQTAQKQPRVSESSFSSELKHINFLSVESALWQRFCAHTLNIYGTPYFGIHQNVFLLLFIYPKILSGQNNSV